MKKLLPLLLVLAACGTDNESAKETLLDAGYSEIHLEGYAPFVCSEDDMYHTKFTALNPSGSRNVKGVVCCGYLKGCTIRH